MNRPSDPDDVANMLANLKFDCKLGYKELIQEENAKKALKRWPLLDRLLAENEKAKPVTPPSLNNTAGDREL